MRNLHPVPTQWSFCEGGSQVSLIRLRSHSLPSGEFQLLQLRLRFQLFLGWCAPLYFFSFLLIVFGVVVVSWVSFFYGWLLFFLQPRAWQVCKLFLACFIEVYVNSHEELPLYPKGSHGSMNLTPAPSRSSPTLLFIDVVFYALR